MNISFWIYFLGEVIEVFLILAKKTSYANTHLSFFITRIV